jgi:predicted nucleic acid-binding protein
LMLLIDLRVLIAYAFKEDPDHHYAEVFFAYAEEEDIDVCLAAAAVFEAEAVWLAGKITVSKEEWFRFVEDIVKSTLLRKIPLTSQIYREHLKTYRKLGGDYTYFDSFHIAAARALDMPIVTTDQRMLNDTSVPSKNLHDFRPD